MERDEAVPQSEYLTDPLALAVLFHATYERLAPNSGYQTRQETRIFDPESPNGKLMLGTCAEVQKAIAAHCPAPGAAPSRWTCPFCLKDKLHERELKRHIRKHVYRDRMSEREAGVPPSEEAERCPRCRSLRRDIPELACFRMPNKWHSVSIGHSAPPAHDPAPWEKPSNRSGNNQTLQWESSPLPPSEEAPTGWEVYAPEGGFDVGKHRYENSYSICMDDGTADHKCIALVFGDTEEEAAALASLIVARASSPPAPTREANFVSHQVYDGPSCSACGAVMVVKEFKCLSCGRTTGCTDVPATTR